MFVVLYCKLRLYIYNVCCSTGAYENQRHVRKKISLLPSAPKMLTATALGIARPSPAATSLVADYDSSEESPS